MPREQSRAAGKTSGLQGQEERIWPFTDTPPHNGDVERAPSSGTCPAGKYIPCYCRLIRPFWETEGCSKKGN